MSDYATYQVVTSPIWMQGDVGTAWSYTCGLVKDGWAEAARQAVKVRFVSQAPPDALPALADLFNVNVAIPLDDASYRTRIKNAWLRWNTSGTKQCIEGALAEAGFNATCKDQNDWAVPHWWDFYVVLTAPFPWEPLADGTWGTAATWGDGGIWSGSPPADLKARALALVQKWKPKHANLVNMIVLVSSELWGGPGLWGDAGASWGGIADYWSL